MKSLLNLTKTQQNNSDKSPEERMCISIITQAFQDALYQGPYRELINYKRDAIDWFKNQSYDFKLICTLSNFEWEYIYDAFIKTQKKGLTSYTEYQYMTLYNKEKPIKKDKFVLKVKHEYF